MTDFIRTEVKNNKPHIEHKDIHQQLKKEVVPTDLEDKKKAAKARLNAHTLGADMKREISMEIKNTLSESFEFIEESCGSGAPEFEFFDTPQQQVVSEGVLDDIATPAVQYPIIGKATGVFAPIGVMSRNNRIYDEDHYDYLLSNQQLVDKIAHRGMLGTIGHHDKKVDDQDLADGKVSHIVSDLHIKEEEDGTRNLYGTLEILDTPAGHLLKTYYDSGIPLFVSSRGGGNLMPVPNESYKRVDKTKYFLETFDIVKNPGFLQAKPVYEKVTEGVEEVSGDQNICEVSDKTVEKDLDKRGDQMVQSLFKEGGTETEPYKKAKELADKRADRQGKEIVQDDETGEHKHVDKIDKLAEALTNFVNILAEKKEYKPEDDEAKEAKEKAEAKEAKDAKEKAEAKLDEAEEERQEDEQLGQTAEDEKKEEKKPEDEKKDDAEDAVADTVSEGKREDKAIEKATQRIINPHKGLGKKDIAKGTVQLNMLNADQAKQIAKDGIENKKQIQYDAKEHAKNHPHVEIPKKEDVAKQLRLGMKEEKESEYEKNMKIANDYDKLMMKQPAKSPDGSDNSVANYYQGKYQEYFDKAMQARNNKTDKAKKAIEEAENIVNQLDMPIASVQSGDEYEKAKEDDKEVLPITYNHQDLARALRADYKFIKGENK